MFFDDSDANTFDEEETDSREQRVEVMDHEYWGVKTASEEDSGSTSTPGTIPNDRAEACFRAAVLAYLGTLPADVPGISVLKEVQFIADCFGYSLVCPDLYLPGGTREGTR